MAVSWASARFMRSGLGKNEVPSETDPHSFPAMQVTGDVAMLNMNG